MILENMGHCKVLVKLFYVIIVLTAVSCKNSNHKTSDNHQIVKDTDEVISCDLTIEKIEEYSNNLKTKFTSNPEFMKDELIEEALNFYNNENSKIFNSIFNSGYNLDVYHNIDENDCEGTIHYNVNGTIEEDGETYNIESSTILSVKMIDNQVKIFKFNFAG